MNNEQILEIYKCATEVFCHGIYVPCDQHPCGWDFISFNMISEKDIFDYEFQNYDISDACYDDHKFEGMTLNRILTETDGKFAFEKSQIDW